ncbi:MAG: hypothetical protein IIZ47_05040 [Erysipelotrichaceae bacterium]|nr:hypothetical protein [Erysipelotrichaceae bacterium]
MNSRFFRPLLLTVSLLFLCACVSSVKVIKAGDFELSVPKQFSFREIDPLPYEEDVKEWTTDYAVLLCEENGIGIALYELSTEDPGSSAYQMTKEDALTGVEQSFSLSGHTIRNSVKSKDDRIIITAEHPGNYNMDDADQFRKYYAGVYEKGNRVQRIIVDVPHEAIEKNSEWIIRFLKEYEIAD